MESMLREALAAHKAGKADETDAKIAAYRTLYQKNSGRLE